MRVMKSLPGAAATEVDENSKRKAKESPENKDGFQLVSRKDRKKTKTSKEKKNQ